MSAPNPTTITRLTTAAIEGMAQAGEGTATEDEVICAVLTLALYIVCAARDRGANVAALRVGVERIWRECSDAEQTTTH